MAAPDNRGQIAGIHEDVPGTQCICPDGPRPASSGKRASRPIQTQQSRRRKCVESRDPWLETPSGDNGVVRLVPSSKVSRERQLFKVALQTVLQDLDSAVNVNGHSIRADTQPLADLYIREALVDAAFQALLHLAGQILHRLLHRSCPFQIENSTLRIRVCGRNPVHTRIARFVVFAIGGKSLQLGASSLPFPMTQSYVIGNRKQPRDKCGLAPQILDCLVHIDKHLLREVAAVLWGKPLTEKECRNGVVIPFKDLSEVFFQITAFYELPDKTVAHLFRRRHAAYHSGRLFDKQDYRAS